MAMEKNPEILQKFQQILAKHKISNSLDYLTVGRNRNVFKNHQEEEIPKMRILNNGLLMTYKGNLERLEADVQKFSKDKYETEFISSNELMRKMMDEAPLIH